MKKIPGEHFLSHNSGKILYAAFCTESWLELINKFAIFPLHHAHLNFGFLFALQPVSMILTLPFKTWENKLPCKLVP